MDKSKETIQSVVKYLRELSIIVAGVSITVGVGLWVNQNNNDKDQKQYLNAIILELKENIQILDDAAKFLEDWDNYAKYIDSHDKESLHPDSIRGTDYPGIGEIKIAVFHTSAFEMFKISGAMRLINNKDFLRSLWITYLRLENIKTALDAYYQYKKEECIKESQLNRAGNPTPVPLYDFFKSMSDSGILEGCKQSLKLMEELVEGLENSLIIKR